MCVTPNTNRTKTLSTGAHRRLCNHWLRTHPDRTWLVQRLVDLGFVDIKPVKLDGIVHQDFFAIIHRNHILQRVSPAPNRLWPGGSTVGVIRGIHDLVDTDFITASDAVAFVPKGGPHIGRENFTGFLGECRTLGYPALLKLMVQLFQ